MSTVNKKGQKKESLFFLLLSHHRADKLHRTIQVRVGQRDLYVCARGVGRYSGLIVSFILNGFLSIPLWIYSFCFVFFPLPSTIDWATQKIGLRESGNSIRVSTGFLLGVSQALLILSYMKGLRQTTVFGVTVLIIYFLCFCIARYWRRGSE